MIALSGLYHFFNMGATELVSRHIESVSGHIAPALVSSLWQGVVLAAVVGFCLSLVPNTTAKVRFSIWSVVFIVLAALPAWSACQAYRPVTLSAVSSAPHLHLGPAWSYALAALWLAAVFVRLVHLAVQTVGLRATWKSAVPVSMERLPELRLGDVELCVSTELDRPSVIGFFAPRILIPAWLFDQLTPGELEQIVLHELEHLRRRDDWINLFQKIGLVFFPLSPALFWIDRRLAIERELACDDGVLGRTLAPRAYATCLTSLVERRLEYRHRNRLTLLALGAVGAVRRSDFSRRIESILGFGQRSTSKPAHARALAGLLVAGVLGCAFVLAHAPQLVSFTTTTAAPSVSAQMFDATRVHTSRNPSARYVNAVFHDPGTAVVNAHVRRLPKRQLKLKPHAAVPVAPMAAVYSATVPRPNRSWMVLSSWQRSAVQPVLVTLPDGRTFLATYAADPNQAGWLILQL
jgi:beta-lactamase regulating signal transducer with metallopeptidase domain